MTLDELIDKFPEPMKPWAMEYGPVFLKMTADEIKEWIEMLIRGNMNAAYQVLLDKMDGGGLVDEWAGITAAWQEANKNNAAKIELQQAAAAGALKILLIIALGAVGL